MTLHGDNLSIRGVKRKRPNNRELKEEDKEAIVRRKLHHSLGELRRTVKKAKAFEVQKTLKKLKDARRKDPDSDIAKDLGAQMEVLKHLSYDQLAKSALATKFRKDKTLSVDSSMRAVLAELSRNPISLGEPGTPLAKVQSRILSSKVLASEVASTMEILRTLLDPSMGSHDTEVADDVRPLSDVTERNASSLKPIDEEYGNTSEAEENVEQGKGWESGTVNTASEMGSARIRDSDDVASGSESSTDEADIPPAGPRSKRPLSHGGSKGLSEFLPSLSVGFARGNSDSEFSDGETYLEDETRKNRRGQRARRAIWEKKFGKNANHIRKSQRTTIRETRRRPADIDRRSGKGNQSIRSGRTPIPAGTSQGVESLSSTKRRLRPGDDREMQGNRPIHPSWVAKRKQRVASIVPSQATKIVFAES